MWVRQGDVVTVAHYDSDGVNVVDSHQVAIVSPTPTATPVSTPIPPVSAANWLSLIVLAGVLAVAIAWRPGGSTMSRTRGAQG